MTNVRARCKEIYNFPAEFFAACVAGSGQLVGVRHKHRLALPVIPQILIFPVPVYVQIQLRELRVRVGARAEWEQERYFWRVHAVFARFVKNLKDFSV